jgi:hypothetical protein
VQGKPLAAFVCPGHPLLDATIDILLERHGDLLKRGSILIDPNDRGENARRWFTWSIPLRTPGWIFQANIELSLSACSLWR